MAIKGAIFDFNSVVIDSVDLDMFFDGIKKFKRPLPLAALYYIRHHFANQLGKLDSYNFWRKVFGLTKKQFPKKVYLEMIVNPYEKKTKYIPEVVELLKELKKRKIKLCLLSNSCEDHSDVNKKLGRYDFFDEILLSDEVGLMKPDPRFFKLAVKKIRLKPEECIFVDDRYHNIFVAGLLGMKGILFQNQKNFKKQVLQMLD